MDVDLRCCWWLQAVGRQDVGHADGEKSQHKTENPGATTGFALTKDVPFVSCSAALVDHDTPDALSISSLSAGMHCVVAYAFACFPALGLTGLVVFL